MAVYGATRLSGCVHCHAIVARGGDQVPWRDRQGRDRCPAREPELPHEVPACAESIDPGQADPV